MPGARSAPSSRFFLDTNVLVYSFSGQDASKRTTARTLADADGAWVSTQVLSELAHVLTRRFGVAPGEVKARVSSIAERCFVATVTPPIVLDALRIMDKYGYAFFDSQIIAASLACGASILYSEDMHDGQEIDDMLSIRSPFRARVEERTRPYRARLRRVASTG